MQSLDDLVWPVESGLIQDVEKSAVNCFYRNCAVDGRAFQAVLRDECGRWHPDRAAVKWGPLPQKVCDKIGVVYATLHEYYREVTRDPFRPFAFYGWHEQ